MHSSASHCADCNTPDPPWASINRGVLICDDCCSIHRVLGRHVSCIRSLYSVWPPMLKEMVYTLVNKGANSIWEQALHDSHSKVKFKKPGPKDKLHPNKNDFIMAKYRQLAFIPRLVHKDGTNSVQDLSKQLHASVRTSNLETCLRLVSLGADPNYTHPDRGNTPLHVAAQAGQAMQVELLVVFGANPCSLDRLGHTSEECARIAGHHQLADRLMECQYELTDKLSFFLCGRKPVHSIGEHYLVPQQGSGTKAGMQEARGMLQALNNALFEELAADVYDEVDRRETDALWLTTQQLQSSVAFLPVNPSLSPLRNQTRQKLATLDATEFSALVIDILLDTKRRQMIWKDSSQQLGTVVPSTSDDTAEDQDPHDYDEVPLEEGAGQRRSMGRPQSLADQEKPDLRHRKLHDYSEIDVLPSSVPDRRSVPMPLPFEASRPGTGPKGVGSLPPTPIDEREEEDTVSRAKFDLVKERLKQVTVEKEELAMKSDVLQQKMADLHKQLDRVMDENSQLRVVASRSSSSLTTTPTPPPTSHTPPPRSHTPSPTSPVAPKPDLSSTAPSGDTYTLVDMSKKRSVRKSHQNQTPPSPGPSPSSPPSSSSVPAPTRSHKTSSGSQGATSPTHVSRQDTPLSDSAFEEPERVTTPTSATPTSCPPVEVVLGHTKSITRCIQELLQAAQSQRQSSFQPCSVKITHAVDTMTRTFANKQPPHEVQVSLREVTLAAQRLHGECQKSGHADLAFHTRHIINCAYDVAKAARQLVLSMEQTKA